MVHDDAAVGLTICAKREKLVLSPEGLPWQSELVAGPPITDQLADVAVAVGCVKEGHTSVYDELSGSLAPEVGEGVLRLGPGSGELDGHGAHPEGATVSGEETLDGSKKRIITAKTT